MGNKTPRPLQGQSWRHLQARANWLLSHPTALARMTSQPLKTSLLQCQHASVLKTVNQLGAQLFPQYRRPSTANTQATLDKINQRKTKDSDDVTSNHFIFLQTRVGNQTAAPYLQIQPNTPAEKYQRLAWLLCIYTGINLLHHHNISHQDIKADNIRLDTESNQAFVIDFDQSQKKSAAGHEIRVITPPTLSTPEEINHQKNNLLKN